MVLSKVKKGMTIKGDDGRKGIVTEVREDCFFARPADRQYTERIALPGVGEAACIMATPFFPRGGGLYKGYWADGCLDSVVYATVEG